jgi:DNA-binding SARP family transcriptional activator
MRLIGRELAVEAFEVRVLGGFEFYDSTGEPLLVKSRKAAALIAYLAHQPGRTQSRERIARLLWEDRPEPYARASLRQVLLSIRRLIPGTPLISEPRPDCVALDSRVVTDVERMESALAEAEVSGLVEAVRLFRGDFLEGVSVRSEAFENWVMCERHRLRSVAMKAMHALLEAKQSARPDEQIEIALRALALDPAQESAHRTLIRLYAASGRRAEALRQYFRCRDALWREFSVRPEPATDLLYRSILAPVPARFGT